MVQPYLRSWGIPGVTGIQETPLKWHQCTDEELGLKKAGLPWTERFFPIAEKSRRNVEIYGSKLKCLDLEDFEMFGNFDSDSAKQLSLKLELCD